MEPLTTPTLTPLDDFQHSKVEAVYPYLLIENIGEEFPLVVSCLEDGSLPLVVKHEGNAIQLDKRISASALTIKKLVDIYPVTAYMSSTEQYKIESTYDLMEIMNGLLQRR